MDEIVADLEVRSKKEPAFLKQPKKTPEGAVLPLHTPVEFKAVPRPISMDSAVIGVMVDAESTQSSGFDARPDGSKVRISRNGRPDTVVDVAISTGRNASSAFQEAQAKVTAKVFQHTFELAKRNLFKVVLPEYSENTEAAPFTGDLEGPRYKWSEKKAQIARGMVDVARDLSSKPGTYTKLPNVNVDGVVELNRALKMTNEVTPDGHVLAVYSYTKKTTGEPLTPQVKLDLADQDKFKGEYGLKKSKGLIGLEKKSQTALQKAAEKTLGKDVVVQDNRLAIVTEVLAISPDTARAIEEAIISNAEVAYGVAGMNPRQKTRAQTLMDKHAGKVLTDELETKGTYKSVPAFTGRRMEETKPSGLVVLQSEVGKFLFGR